MIFRDFLHQVNLPAIVCKANDTKNVVYANRSANMQFNPLSQNEDWQTIDATTTFSDFLSLSKENSQAFWTALEKDAEVIDFKTTVRLYSGEDQRVSLCANFLHVEGASYVLIFVYSYQAKHAPQNISQALATLLEAVYDASTTDESINNALAFVGSFTKVSRTYIFEAVSDTMTSNTYEWCAPGVEPAISQLQNLPKEDYSYDDIIANGLAITDDIRTLTPEDRAILEPQGIKSLALIPIYFRGVPLGYVGFDDCEKYRKWSPTEVQLLQNVSNILASLFTRRNGERNLRYSFDILNTVTDNTENMIFVINPKNWKILFSNNAFSYAVNKNNDDLIDADVRDVVRSWASLPNSPQHFMPVDKDGNLLRDSHSWEFQNVNNCKWYLARGSEIKWIDGKDVYLVTLTEITMQKEYEAQLEYVASTDHMTGVYNREYGRRLLQQLLDSKVTSHSTLAFIDLDGLKKTNDQFGHAAGDAMIRKIVEIINSRVRKSDTLCRWGGDEFLLIMRASEAQTADIIAQIRAQMAAHNATCEDVFTLDFSCGIVPIRSNLGQTVDSLIHDADQKMYEEKERKYAAR